MKSYSAPSVSVYGSVANLTRVFGEVSVKDVGYYPAPPDIIVDNNQSQDGIVVPL